MGRSSRLVAATATVIAVLAGLWWIPATHRVLLLPRAALVGVQGTSMTPALRSGDLVVVEPAASYRRGDVVVFDVADEGVAPTGRVIHRIVGGDATDGFVTRGDHNRYADGLWRPRPADIIGRMWFRIPGAAAWMAWIRAGLLLLLAAGAFLAAHLLVTRMPRRQPLDPTVVIDLRTTAADRDPVDPDPAAAPVGGAATIRPGRPRP